MLRLTWASALLVVVCATHSFAQVSPTAEPPPAPAPAPAAAPAPTPTAVPAAQAAPPAAEPIAPPPPPVPPGTYEGQVNPGDESPIGAGEDDDDSRGDQGGGGSGFEMPPFSVRIDPFNWLLQGRLPLELEVGVWKLISVELVPEFVTSSDPPLRDFSGYESGVTQHSNGLGPLSGTSLGVGFWLDGEPFDGYVLRAIYTNYGYEYKTEDSRGLIDSVTRTTRRLGAFIGSYRRWSFFTIGGGVGLSYELHQQQRCDLRATSTTGGTRITSDSSANCDDQLQVALDRSARATDDVNGFLHPIYLDVRFSIGFIID